MDMITSTLESNDTKGFLNEVFRGASDGFLGIWAKLGPQRFETYSFHVSEIAQAAEAMQALKQHGDVYFERGLQGVRPDAGKRGKEAGVTWVGGLSIDFDTREGPHKGTPPEKLPADLEEVRKLIREAGLPEPTFIVHTGGGVHAHWLYTAPVLIVSDGERAAEKTTAKAWSKRAEKVFTAHGYQLDSTYSLEHLFKAPGTLNHKPCPADPAKPVTLVSTGPRYEQAELRKLLANELKTAARGITGAGPGTLAAQLADEAKKAFLASGKVKKDELPPILAGCAWLQSIVERADRGEKLNQTEWYYAISIVARTTEGRKWVHEISKRDPEEGRYSFEETEATIEHALKDAGPANCLETVQEMLKFDGCVRCPVRGFITSPMTWATVPVELAREQRGTVYVIELRRYLNLTTGKLLPPEAFADGIQARIGSLPHSKMMSSRTTSKVDATDYRPGNPNLVLHNDDGTTAVNLWQRGGVTPAIGDAKPILDFLAHLIPDMRSREHVTQYLAQLLKHPAEKIEHGVIITGGYGTGKSTLRDIMNTMFGAKNVQKIEGEELSDRNNSKWVNCQVLMFEEASQGERFEVYHRTKELVTGEWFRVQDKYIPRFDGRTPRGIFMASNDISPISLLPNDRRWFLCDTPETAETDEEKAANKAFFTNLRAILNRDDSAVAAFMHHLLTEVSLKNFAVKGAPPETAAKKRATEESRTPAAQVLEDLISVGANPFDREVVSGVQVLEAIRMSGWAHTVEKVTMKRIADVIRSVGGFPVNVVDGEQKQVRFTRTLAPRLWGLRNKAKWANATTDELRTEWLGGKPAAEAEVVQLNVRGLARAMAAAS